MAKTLLLADDSVTIQKVVNISFASEDVTLVTVDNGDDAITRAREVRPDLILADVVMPGKSGYEVCEAVKAEPDLAHIPVLLLTGTFESFDEERAARVGAAGHVAKPFEAQTLVSRVNELLAQAPAPAPPPAPAVTDTPPIVPDEAVTAPGDAAADSGDSFDFFDDDLDELAPAPGADPLGAEDTDSAFAFVGDEMESGGAPAQPAAAAAATPPADHTVAMIADEPLGGSDPLGDLSAPASAGPAAVADLDGLDLTPPADAEAPGLARPAAPDEPEDSFSPMAPASLDDDAFDFSRDAESFDRDEPAAPDTVLDDGLMSVDVGDVAQATVLDPNGASGYDVSSSDLGMSLLGDDEPTGADAGVDPVEAARAATPAWENAVDLAADDEPAAAIVDPAEFDADLGAPDAGAGFADLDDDLPEPRTAADEPAAAVFDDEFAPEPEPFGVSDRAEPAGAARALPADAAASADSVLEEIAPALRAQVHDTLEKMAWESFGAVTEKIVTETVDRVEKIAWEVIPQLAEALIKAEIQRLKGESED